MGMVSTFCCHNQAKMEASDALSTLHQCNSPDPSVAVVRRYTNTPCIPQGSSCFLYLNVSTLSGGTSTAQFPLDWLHLCRLLTYSDTEVVLPQEEGVGLKVFLYFWRFCGKAQKRCTASLAQFCCRSLHVPPLLNKKRVPKQRKDWALKCSQNINQARAQLECELAQETQGLAQRYDDW